MVTLAFSRQVVLFTIPAGFTTTVLDADALANPALLQVISKTYVPTVIPVLSSEPPLVDLDPLHQFEAVQLSGFPDVVQDSVV